jgi:hypothetical protein
MMGTPETALPRINPRFRRTRGGGYLRRQQEEIHDMSIELVKFPPAVTELIDAATNIGAKHELGVMKLLALTVTAHITGDQAREHAMVRRNLCELCDRPQSGWRWVFALGCCYRWEGGELFFRTLPICDDCALEHADADELASTLAPMLNMDALVRIGSA